MPNRKKAGIALLRVGYLLGFNYLGNLLLLSKNIHKIIEQINYPEKEILPHSSILKLKSDNNIKDGIHLVQEPEQFKSYFVTFSLKRDNLIDQYAVILSGPDEDGWKYYENFTNMNESYDFRFKDVTFKEIVSNESFVDGYTYLWNNL